jgi:hypothetical protein
MAIMLGCLQMGIDESIEAYTNLMHRVLQNPRSHVTTMGEVQSRFDILDIKRALIEIITRHGLQEDALLYKPSGKCGVCSFKAKKIF